MKKFTVLMSVYINEKADYLRTCLESLEKQTLQANEILILCDGPVTEELDVVLEEYLNTYPNLIKIVRFEENRGLGITLADGVKLAKYPLIARMDTDDIARPDRFEKQIACFNQEKNLGVLGSDIQEFDTDPNKPYAERIVPHSHEEIYRFSKRRNPFNHMTVVYKKEEVLKAGNYQDLKGFEDYYLWVRMLKQGSIAKNIAEPLVLARADKEMYKRRGGWAYFINGLDAYNKIYEVGIAEPKDKAIRIIGQALINLAPNTLRAKLYEYLLRK